MLWKKNGAQTEFYSPRLFGVMIGMFLSAPGPWNQPDHQCLTVSSRKQPVHQCLTVSWVNDPINKTTSPPDQCLTVSWVNDPINKTTSPPVLDCVMSEWSHQQNNQSTNAWLCHEWMIPSTKQPVHQCLTVSWVNDPINKTTSPPMLHRVIMGEWSHQQINGENTPPVCATEYRPCCGKSCKPFPGLTVNMNWQPKGPFRKKNPLFLLECIVFCFVCVCVCFV